MWRNVIFLMIAALPVLAQAEQSLVERAEELRGQKQETYAPSWCEGPAKYIPALWKIETDILKSTPVENMETDGDPAKYENILTWYLLTEDLASLEKWSNTMANPAELAKAEFALATLNFVDAEKYFRATLENPDPTFQRLGKIGLSKVLQKQQKYRDALDILVSAWTPDQLSDDVIFQAAMCKQRLGETSESMDLFEEVLKWNQYHELGHYYLGNGFARKNYSELESTSEYLKCDGSTICAREFVIDGSTEWMAGEYDSALSHFMEALKLVPDYGRAHNGVAKCLEQMRLRENVYRDADQAAFDAKPFPQIPMIDQYILGWNTLSDRHKKQVAISVEPWKDYVPVLVACGSHHYIKPLHEKLSECPGLETIADQRISYDSRLWDDVRGCGGYTTVTGIEDVERSIYNKYNTVLHELTHQVHGVFPPVDQTRIEDLYRVASAKDAEGEEIFVSRYQGSSVWEYFAEGMNSYFSPQRNEYDTREITKERLFKLDPELVTLLEHYMAAPNIETCYPVGFVNAATNEVELGNLAGAMEYARKAEARDANSEVVLGVLAHISSLEDKDSISIAYAEKLVKSYPDKANSYSELASSRAFANGDFVAVLPLLAEGLAKTSGSERVQLVKENAGWQFTCGKFEEAVVNYKDVLDAQGTDDDALRGYAEALLWAGQPAKSDSVYQVALIRRTGSVGLRLDYARMLLLTGKLAEAKVQIDEAELLKPGDGRVAAHRAWWANLSGDRESALNNTIIASDQYPDDATVQAIAANILNKPVKPESYVPGWRYNLKESSYEAVNFWDASTKTLLTNGLNLLSN
jgi:tetratricopeptide (TPR) repeat protein